MIPSVETSTGSSQIHNTFGLYTDETPNDINVVGPPTLVIVIDTPPSAGCAETQEAIVSVTQAA